MILLTLLTSAFAADTGTWYVGLDVLALGTIPRGVVSRAVLPFFSNFEDGVALQGGVFLDDHDALELRTAVGSSHPDTRVVQVQAGYCRYFLHRHLFVGAFLRYVDNASLLTDEQFHEISPYVTVGGRWNPVGPLYLDTRVGWDFASVAWSSVAHSEAGVGFLRMPPSLVLDAGVQF